MKRWIAMGAATATAAATVSLLSMSNASAGDDADLTAVLRDATGEKVGTVNFVELDGETWVSTDLVNNDIVNSGFHGFHVHANNLPDGGTGCVADPNQPSSTWFVSADGHLSEEGQSHGSHTGDMPSVLVQGDGSARLQFSTRAFSLDDLLGKAIVLHVGPDNFGNVPLGDAPDQYKANAADATTKTGKTGNAGDRLACGVVEVSPDE